MKIVETSMMAHMGVEGSALNIVEKVFVANIVPVVKSVADINVKSCVHLMELGNANRVVKY